MKNILIFLLILFCVSCSSSSHNKKSTKSVVCPQVLYASEHNKYLDSDENLITYDNLTFKADLNNHVFSSVCTKTGDIISIPLDILFIIKPLKITSAKINLPIYSAILDKDKNIIDIQYFFISGKINKDFDNKNFVETELSQSINIITKTENSVSQVILGFMLDKNREKLLN